MKINNFFEKGYYINLDRRVDRRIEFENEMKITGLDGFFERISAFDSINEIDVAKKHHFCGKTHHTIFEKAKKEGYNNILILEDDMVFYNEGEMKGIEIIENSLDQLQKDNWDLIYFGGHPRDNIIKLINNNLCEIKNMLTTHAIGYNKSSFDTMLTYVPFADGAIDSWISAQSNFKKFLSYPMATYQRSGVSDLDAYGNSPGFGHFLRTYYSPRFEKQF